MAKRPRLRNNASWLVTADRYVAEAQAEWAVAIARPVKTGRRRGHQPRKTAAGPASNHLAIADRYIAETETRLARQATLIRHLAAGNQETDKADDQFWVMAQLLDAMRDRRQLLAESERQQDPPTTASRESPRWPGDVNRAVSLIPGSGPQL